MQNRQAGLSGILKAGLSRHFPGTKAGIKSRVFRTIAVSLLLIISLLIIVFILSDPVFFNPAELPHRETLGAIFAFFSLSAFACIACYALYLFLGLWGVYNTRLFRRVRTAWLMVKTFAVNRARDWHLLLNRRKTMRSFPAAPALYNEHQGSMSGNSLAANGKLLLMVAAMVIASRLFIYFVGYIAYVYFSKVKIGFFESFYSIWVRWDSPHYIFLAENWYTNLDENRLLIVFFPLYSTLVKLLKFIIPNTVVSAVIVSNLCLVAACFYLVKLVALDYGRETGFRVVKYVLIYPFSFFLGIVYTEGLFLALLVIFFYYLRKKNWLLAGIAGFLASLTRLYGILLLIPACSEIVLSSDFKSFIRSLDWKRFRQYLLKICLFLVLIPAGSLLYFYINKDITGDWFRFLEYQRNHWHNAFGFIGNTLQGIVSTMSDPREDPNSKICIWWPTILSFILALAMMIYGMKKMRISYLLFMIVYTFIAYSLTWLISAERYMIVLFPLYIPLALAGKTRWADTALTVVSAALLCYCIFLFVIIGFVY